MKSVFTLICALLISVSAQGYEVEDSFGKHYFSEPPERVVVTDWTLLEQLLELGIEPVGAPDLALYQTYAARYPELPTTTIDIGLRERPSLSTLRTIAPDLIILGTNQDDLARPFSQFARVMYYNSFSDRYRTNGDKSRQRFLQLATLFQKQELAQEKLAQLDNRLENYRETLVSRYSDKPPRVAIVRFVTENRVRVYGPNSMVSHTLDALNLPQTHLGTDTIWGYSEHSLTSLSGWENTHILVIQPNTFAPSLEQNSTWQALKERNTVLTTGPFWTYGGAMSIGYIADSVMTSLGAVSRTE